MPPKLLKLPLFSQVRRSEKTGYTEKICTRQPIEFVSLRRDSISLSQQRFSSDNNVFFFFFSDPFFELEQLTFLVVEAMKSDFISRTIKNCWHETYISFFFQ